jgi:hypothetical protein
MHLAHARIVLAKILHADTQLIGFTSLYIILFRAA